jgi:hypothetical protein
MPITSDTPAGGAGPTRTQVALGRKRYTVVHDAQGIIRIEWVDAVRGRRPLMLDGVLARKVIAEFRLRSEPPAKSGLDVVLERRESQINRVIKALAHLPVGRQVAILVMWMSADDVDVMLETIEKGEI